MMQEGAHILETTMLDYTRRTFCIGLGVSWEDLTDSEKKLLYESAIYEEGYYKRLYEEAMKHSKKSRCIFKRLRRK